MRPLRHPRRGIIPPADFLPLAEETGLIVAIGEWVLHQACGQIKLWDQECPTARALFVSINLSPRQIQDGGLCATVERIFAQTGTSPSRLVFEITETLVLNDDARTAATLQAIVAFAKALNLVTDAEGIESPEQAEHLKRLGCDWGQGFYFAKPLPRADVSLLLATNPSFRPLPPPQ